jgi:hypothetical protein
VLWLSVVGARVYWLLIFTNDSFPVRFLFFSFLSLSLSLFFFFIQDVGFIGVCD